MVLRGGMLLATLLALGGLQGCFSARRPVTVDAWRGRKDRGRVFWMTVWLRAGRARSALLACRQTSLRSLKRGKPRGLKNAGDRFSSDHGSHPSVQSPLAQTLVTMQNWTFDRDAGSDFPAGRVSSVANLPLTSSPCTDVNARQEGPYEWRATERVAHHS